MRMVEAGDEVIVTYEARKPTARRSATPRSSPSPARRSASVEVYFGWDLE